MSRKLFFATVAFAIAVNLTDHAFAGANDYVFEPVKAEVKKGDDVVVSVRLKHKATGKPVTDAVIVQTRIDMSPDAMGEMASPLTAVPSNEPGVYSFKTDLSMARPVAPEHRGQGARRSRRRSSEKSRSAQPGDAMRRLGGAILLALGVSAGAAGGYWYARLPAGVPASTVAPESAAAAAERKILYYRDPSGAPYWSAEPKKDAARPRLSSGFRGRGNLVRARREEADRASAGGPRKILYYRNPMGLPDTSPVPKKDWMGMDYIPVYEGEEQDDGKTVKVSLDKVQRSGVRTEAVEARVIVRPVRAVGTVMHDESRLTIVTMRSDGFIEDLFVSRTGQHVHAGEPLFRVYSADIQRAQIDLLIAMGTSQRGSGVAASDASRNVEGALQRLRNLAVPESRIREVRENGANPRTLDWPAPATGDVIEKKIINGQRVQAGPGALSHRRPRPPLGHRRRRRKRSVRDQDRHPRHASRSAPTRHSRSKAK